MNRKLNMPIIYVSLIVLLGTLVFGFQNYDDKRKKYIRAESTLYKSLNIEVEKNLEEKKFHGSSKEETQKKIEALYSKLTTGNENERLRAVCQIGDFDGEKVLSALLIALRDRSHLVRYHAVQKLGDLGYQKAVQPLIQALNDENYWVRFHAAWSLGKLKAREATDPLLLALEDPEAKVRYFAAQSLKSVLTKGDNHVTELLFHALEKNDLGVRLHIIDALGNIGDSDMIPYLESYLDNKSRAQNLALLSSIAKIGGDKARPIIRRTAENHRDAIVRVHASKLLKNPSISYHISKIKK